MPFSSTESCSGEDWTWIFENVLKPAVEDAGLDYECRRSTATRGNLVAAILQDLKEAYVVLADLTDRNANVFYELGVRHSLTDRSIILAQSSEDIPFDLQAYAYHVYGWKTEEMRFQLTEKLRQLLRDVDTNPDRPDNPVSDFLGRANAPTQAIEPVQIAPSEVATAQPLAGPGAEGLNATGFAKTLTASGSPTAVNAVLRLTRSELTQLMIGTMETLDQRPRSESIQVDQIPVVASEHIAEMEPHIQKVEEFILACVEEDWVPGTRMGLRLAGGMDISQ